MLDIDDLWSHLLSEDPPLIRKAWSELKDDEASAILAHLRRMAEEEGWAEVQQQAARAALRVIQDNAEVGGF